MERWNLERLNPRARIPSRWTQGPEVLGIELLLVAPLSHLHRHGREIESDVRVENMNGRRGRKGEAIGKGPALIWSGGRRRRPVRRGSEELETGAALVGEKLQNELLSI